MAFDIGVVFLAREPGALVDGVHSEMVNGGIPYPIRHCCSLWLFDYPFVL